MSSFPWQRLSAPKRDISLLPPPPPPSMWASITFPLLERDRLLIFLAGATAASLLPAVWRRLRRRGLLPPGPAVGQLDRSRPASAGPSASDPRRTVDEHLQSSFGGLQEVLPYDFGPKDALRFNAQLALLCERHCDALRDFTGEHGDPTALVLGCSVGGAAFELARSFPHVLGIDQSRSLIEAATTLKERGWMRYQAIEEGELVEQRTAAVPQDINRDRVRFQQGDACSLPPRLAAADAVLAPNLLCRLPNPRAFLDRVPSLVKPGGVLLLASPYSWLEACTPRDKWLGGFTDQDGKPVSSADTLKRLLPAHFTLVEEQEVPFLIRHHRRRYQWGVSHVTVWRRS